MSEESKKVIGIYIGRRFGAVTKAKRGLRYLYRVLGTEEDLDEVTETLSEASRADDGNVGWWSTKMHDFGPAGSVIEFGVPDTAEYDHAGRPNRLYQRGKFQDMLADDELVKKLQLLDQTNWEMSRENSRRKKMADQNLLSDMIDEMRNISREMSWDERRALIAYIIERLM